MKLFHFSRRIKASRSPRVTVSPSNSPNGYSRREFTTWATPRSFWYVNPSDKESMVGGDLFVADVDEDSLLSFSDVDFSSCRDSFGRIDFDGLLESARADGKVGFRYTVSGRDIVVLFDDVEAVRAAIWN